MKLKKLLSCLLVLAMSMLLFAGCGAKPAEDAKPADDAKPAEDAYRVALLLTGYINDAGWNQSSYEGMKKAETDMGVVGVYNEAIPQPDQETVMRDFAGQGYNMILCAGNEFSDAAIKVSPDFPDTIFAVMNGNECGGTNLGAYRFNTPQTGFLAGALAASFCTGDTVGMITGTTAPHLKDATEAFVVGANYVNPDLKVLTGYAETMTDIAKGKEMAMAFIEQGADVICASANSASLGAIEASKEKGIRHIGYISDQNELAPDTVVASMIQSNELMVNAIIKSGVDGEFTPTLHLFGINEGAIYISDYHGHDSKLTAEQLAKLDEIVAGIKDGSLKEAGILPKSTFEK